MRKKLTVALIKTVMMMTVISFVLSIITCPASANEGDKPSKKAFLGAVAGPGKLAEKHISHANSNTPPFNVGQVAGHIKGTVASEKGDPLEGVNILVKG